MNETIKKEMESLKKDNVNLAAKIKEVEGRKKKCIIRLTKWTTSWDNQMLKYKVYLHLKTENVEKVAMDVLKI